MAHIGLKEIVVLSGKGGTGKTSITAAFALLADTEAVVADCDVDAADMHLLLGPDFAQRESFYSGQVAKIDPERCIQCGQCADVCHFGAVQIADGVHSIQALRCEGCRYCARVCSAHAIQMEDRKAGEWFYSTIKNGGIMIHAALGIASDNSGKLVAHVKNEARKAAGELDRPIVLVDGSPGIGCPVVSSLSGADYVVYVTEPTVSGLHDLQRVAQTAAGFGMPSGCIINKADLYPAMAEKIRVFIQEAGIEYLGDLPYSEAFPKAMLEAKSVVEQTNSDVKELLVKMWQKVRSSVFKN